MELQTNNITYSVVLRICFRLYGIYLFIPGLLKSLILVPSIIIDFETPIILMFTKLEDALTGVTYLAIGIILFIFAPIISNKIIDSEKQISIRSEELSLLVQIVLKLIFIIILIQVLSTLTVASVFFIVLGLTESFEINDTTKLLVPFIFLVLLLIFNANIKRLTKIIIK
ncbi:hypothetical protein PCCS19_26400 [Paenibacillus sp. CCS19]|nr:hypothetical protein PCCS19_26400 [Paenibacillus cellulosilyticus]